MELQSRANQICAAALWIFWVSICFTFYFSSPLPEDHLIYTLIACSQNPEHLYYWGGLLSGFIDPTGLQAGNFTERWTALFSIRLFNLVFSDHVVASRAAAFATFSALIAAGYFWLHKRHSAKAGIFYLILTICVMQKIKNHAFDFHADSLGTLFSVLTLIAYFELRNTVGWQKTLAMATGFFGWCGAFSKIHHAGVLIVLVGILLIQRRWRNVLWVFAGVLLGAALFTALLFAFYTPEMRAAIVKVTLKVLRAYIVERGVQTGAPQSYLREWIGMIWHRSYFPWILCLFFLSPLLYKKGIQRYTSLSFLGFLSAFLFLSYFATFPHNHMYPMILFFLLPLAMAVFFANQVKQDRTVYIATGLCILTCLLAVCCLPVEIPLTNNDKWAFGLSILCLPFVALFRSDVALALLLISQTYSQTALTYARYKIWFQGYVPIFTEIVEKIDPEYLKKGRVLTVLETERGEYSNDYRERLLVTTLGTRVFPSATVVPWSLEQAVNPVNLQRLNEFEVVITDQPQWADKFLSKLFVREKATPEGAPKFYYYVRKK